jgi:hypothetical protein
MRTYRMTAHCHQRPLRIFSELRARLCLNPLGALCPIPKPLSLSCRPFPGPADGAPAAPKIPPERCSCIGSDGSRQQWTPSRSVPERVATAARAVCVAPGRVVRSHPGCLGEQALQEVVPGRLLRDSLPDLRIRSRRWSVIFRAQPAPPASFEPRPGFETPIFPPHSFSREGFVY